MGEFIQNILSKDILDFANREMQNYRDLSWL